MNIGLPETNNLSIGYHSNRGNELLHDRMKTNDERSKTVMKTAADKKRNTKPSEIKPGENVLVKQQKVNKLTPPFDPRPYVITQKKGSMITARGDDRYITRNSSHFKRIHGEPSSYFSDEEEEPEKGFEPSQPAHS